MGDPRKQRRKYERPTHPWKAERITEEKEICRKYGLKNRKELWRVKSKIRRFRQQARNLLASSGDEVMKEKKELFDKLKRLGIHDNPTVEDVLAIKAEDLLDRRLQSIVYSRGIANTIKEARQLVTHNHVIVGNRIVNIPSYLISKVEEDRISLKGGIVRVISPKKEPQKADRKEEPEEEPKKAEKKEEAKEEKSGKKDESKEEPQKADRKESPKEPKKESESNEPQKEEVKESDKEGKG